MKKSFVIVLVIQFFIIATVLVYAFVQKGIADENLLVANITRAEAQKQMELAKVNAEQQREVVRALQAKLTECENGK